MPQNDLRKTYKSNQFRHENVVPNELMTVEFRGNDPTDLTDNPMRMWARTDTGELSYTVDGVNIFPIAGRVDLPYIDVKWFGAVGNGIVNDTAPIQAALNACPDGGTVVISDGIYLVSASLKVSDKTITIIFNGTIKDRFTVWTQDFTNTSLNGKGILAFSNCAVTLLGNGGISFDGSSGEPGLAITVRKFIYLFECSPVLIDGLHTENHTGSAVASFGCVDFTHSNCIHKGGQYTVLCSRSNHVRVENLSIYNPVFNGITVLNRGEFSNAVYPEVRPSDVYIGGCYVYRTISANLYAVGLTADSCDNVVVTGNVVDGANVGTMCYSFAGTKGGQIYGNRAMNLTNTSNGTDTYAGIGMECDTVTDISFAGNTFSECLIGYLVLFSTNCSYSGVYRCEAARNQTKVTGAGSAGMFAVGNIVNQSTNIQIHDCICEAGNHFIRGQINCDGLSIKNVNCNDVFERFLFFSAGSLSRVEIDGVILKEPGNAERVLTFSDDVLGDINVVNVHITAATAPGLSRYFFRATKAGAKYRISNCVAQNLDQGVTIPFDQIAELRVENCDFIGVPTGALLTVGASSKTIFTGIKLDGVRIADRGNNSPIVYATVAPTTNAVFIGQIYVNTTTQTSYMAVQTGTGSTDWKQLTP